MRNMAKRRTHGGTREGAGRPPLPIEEKTPSKLITFRLSGDDLELFESLGLDGEANSATAKRLVLGVLEAHRQDKMK